MVNKIILISCWSKPLDPKWMGGSSTWNPKNMSVNWWQKLILLLKNEGYLIYQLGQGPEIKLKNIDRYIWDEDIWKITEKYFPIAKTIICCDNVWGHLTWYMNKKAIVIFSRSDPKIFGHPENINLLKNESYLRPNQFERWEQSPPYDSNSFVSPEEVIKALKQNFQD